MHETSSMTYAEAGINEKRTKPNLELRVEDLHAEIDRLVGAWESISDRLNHVMAPDFEAGALREEDEDVVHQSTYGRLIQEAEDRVARIREQMNRALDMMEI